MIDQALLSWIEANIDPNDPAHAHAKEWASRARELRQRQAKLFTLTQRLLDIDCPDGAECIVTEYKYVSEELSSLSHRMGEFVSRLRAAPETMQ